MENLEIINNLAIPLCYYYKGSTNCELLIEKNKHNLLTIKTQYNETITENITTLEMCDIIKELVSEKFS